MNFKLLTLLIGLGLVMGWWLASPGGVSMGLSRDYQASVPKISGPIEQSALNAALADLQKRRAWSTKPPEAADGDAVDQAETGKQRSQTRVKPQGLDRFSLLGVIRVKGQPPEALLLDRAAEQDAALATLSARVGELLRGTEVRLIQITPTGALVQLNDQQRWLVLFPRSELEDNFDRASDIQGSTGS